MTSGSLRCGLPTFGADQYQLPEQNDQIQKFFFHQMIFVKSGALLGRFFGPVFREDIKCLGKNNCYPLAFGFPALIILLGVLILLIARNFFIKRPPGGNLMGKVFACICYIIKLKIKCLKKDCCLNRLEAKYGKKLMDDTKKIIRVIFVLMGVSITHVSFNKIHDGFIKLLK